MNAQDHPESSSIEPTRHPDELDPYDVERTPWFVVAATAIVLASAFGPLVFDLLKELP